MQKKHSKSPLQEEILPPKQGKENQQKEAKEPKDPVKAVFSKERILTESSDASRELYNQSRYGSLHDDGRVQLSLIETIYLIDKKKLKVYDSKNKEIGFEILLKKSQKEEPNFWVRYVVYKDIREARDRRG